MRGLRAEGWLESREERGLAVLLWRLTRAGRSAMAAAEERERPLCSRCGNHAAATLLGLSICALCAGLVKLTPEGERVVSEMIERRSHDGD